LIKTENYTDPHEVGGKICDITGIDIFKNTRKKEYVELRALVCYTLREDLNFGYKRIADYFNSKGKIMERCNARHSAKMYPIYKKYNKNLERLEGSFQFRSSIEKNEKLTLHNKLANLQYRYDKLKKELDNPIVKTLYNIPESKWGQVQERIQLLKNSWDWKSKDKCSIIESY
tara:strand:+ start:38 stop:556 length:519 start_codon:yes stop_codon:yes gene_type:complete